MKQSGEVTCNQHNTCNIKAGDEPGQCPHKIPHIPIIVKTFPKPRDGTERKANLTCHTDDGLCCEIDKYTQCR